MFLPLFADSERAASKGLDFLKSQLASEFYTVAWPLNRESSLGEQRLQLLGNLDDAIGKLPPDAVLVLDATGSLRQDLALEVVSYVNHRREPLRAGGLRLLLCWPVALKDELLSKAPDLWSVRAASPFVEESDVAQAQEQQTLIELTPTSIASSRLMTDARARQLQRWQRYRNLKRADLSPRDALDLANFQYEQLQWASAAELAEAVFFAVESQGDFSNDGLALIEALNVLSNARSQLGNSAGALEASQVAALEARHLAKTNPSAYEPDLAGSIHNLANRLSETGDRPGALKAAQEAVDIYKRLAKTNLAAYEPILVGSINNLANRLSETGDRPGALKAAQEAVEIRRRLAKTNPAYEPVLAGSINNLAIRLSETGDRPGALKAAQEAVNIRRRLARANPAAYEPYLAQSANNLANRLSETGDRPAALKAAQQAVEIYKRLAKTGPATYEPNLAASINNLANRLSETGDRPGALKAAREAVEIGRSLAKTNPAAYEPELAMSIHNLANHLSEIGDRPGALKAAREAVALYEKVNQHTPGAFDRQLATARRVLAGLS